MLKDEWQKKRALVEETLVRELHEEDAFDARLTDAMKYSLMAGGKRLRPVLLMASADAVGGRGEDYLPAACALEMIHTYSLIHDDLPAMDNDDYRRGVPTNHVIYGAGLATLAGDALLTLAFETLTRQDGVGAETLLRVIREIGVAAGANGMVGGQALDLASEGKHIGRETMYKMHMAKTGALFRAAIRSGAILAGASDDALETLTEYADAFGLAFQITDDILDVTGDAKTIGKPVGSDERNHKSTFVTSASLVDAKARAREEVDRARRALLPLGGKATFLDELAEYLISRDH